MNTKLPEKGRKEVVAIFRYFTGTPKERARLVKATAGMHHVSACLIRLVLREGGIAAEWAVTRRELAERSAYRTQGARIERARHLAYAALLADLQS